MYWRPPRYPGGDGIDRRQLRHHADLDGLDIEIAEYRIDLRGHEILGHLMNGGEAVCVLLGPGRDYRPAGNAELGSRLQLRLHLAPAPGTLTSHRTSDT